MDDLTNETLSIPIILKHLERDKALVSVYGKFGKNKIQIALYKVFIKRYETGEYHCYRDNITDNNFVFSFYPSNVLYISRIKREGGCFEIEISEDIDKEE